ncbi:MAG TPA: Ig-like domain-containing protein, partial [Ilumatobacteraceae bacterium]|nr:Ig-like domain-containing protein [Ilumatobacteraceae bacterium]
DVTVNGDDLDEGEWEDFFLSLDSPVNADFGFGGMFSSARGRILDDDDPGPGSVRFELSADTVSEGAGTATIHVLRQGAGTGAVSVRVDATGGTAVQGTDYTFSSTVVSWADGVVGLKDITISINQDPDVEGDETIDLSLSQATGGATIVEPSTMTLTIDDDDANPPPVVDAGADLTGFAEGESVQLAGSATDSEPLTILWTAAPGLDVDALADCSFVNATDPATSVSCTDDGTWTLTLTADDGSNDPVADSLTLTLTNADPTVAITAPAQDAVFAVGASVDLSATLDDPGGNDRLDCSIDWGDGPAEAGTIALGVCTGSHTYAAPGPYTITITATDDDGGSGSDTVGITVEAAPAANHRPYAVDDKASAHGTGPSFIGVLLNDTDIDGDALEIVAFDDRAGRVDCGAGACTYTGISGFDGTDSFTYTVSDGQGGTARATVRVRVRPNRPPTALDDIADAHGTGQRIVPVLFNDSDPERDQLTPHVVGPGPLNGTAGCDLSGCFYSADAGYTGIDTFDYEIDDGHDGTATATVTVTVLANRGPTAVDDAAIAHGIGGLEIGVLGNDRDNEGDALTVGSFTQPAPGLGSVTCGSSCTYTPPAIPPSGAGAYPFTATFTYVADDQHGGTDTAVVSVTVRSNTNPRARDDRMSAPGLGPGLASIGTVAPLPNDEDPDGDELIIESWTDGTNGSVVCLPPNQNSPWRCNYTPKPGYVGPDTFTYTVYDGHGGPGTTSGNATATVTVTVAENHPPDARDDEVVAHGVTEEPLFLLSNDDDP